MRTYKLPVRITKTKRCPEGFYLLVNRSRLHFKKRSDAIEAIEAILSMNRIQVVSVREFQQRRKHRQAVPVEPQRAPSCVG